MGIEKLVRLFMWTCVVVFILMFTVIIIIGHAHSFNF